MAILLIAVALGVSLPAILSGGGKLERVGFVGGSTATTTGIVTEAGRLAGVSTVAVPEPSLAAAAAGLRSGDVSAVLVSDSEVLVKQVPLGGPSGVLETLSQLAGLSRLIQEVPGAAAAVTQGVALPVHGLEPPATPLSSRLTGLFTIVLVWVLISVYGSQIAMGIGEEKSSRVVEVLLSSLRPVQLLIGKVGGIGLLALGQAAAMVTVFIVAGFASGSSLVHGPALGIVVTGGVFLVLGYAFYSWMYAAAGSMAERQDQVQTLALPLSLPILLGYIFSITVASTGHADPFFVILAYLPPTAPFCMPVLVALDQVAWWGFVISVLITITGTVGMAIFAARIYRRAVLRTGGRVRVRDVLARTSH